MDNKFLKYDRMVEEALRGVVRRALENTIEHGLPSDHHFYITFRTRSPGVMIPDFLLERYPDEMTIIIQHQYWDLRVNVFEFSVSLSFDNKIVEMTIPFAALTAFVDPSVKFGLQFTADDSLQTTESGSTPRENDKNPSEKIKNDDIPVTSNVTKADNDSEENVIKQSAEIVSLETFRKK
jgi:hypothetical protein|tara:strand:+ start:1962 stop:2501 length:540 start_codon:yes stop_codon:yes gene_type:complete